MKCPGPAFCPYSSEKRFGLVCALIALLFCLMTAVAFAAIVKGKDGVITGSVCTAMTAVVTTILVGGLHKHRQSLVDAAKDLKGGDANESGNQGS